MYTKEEAEGKRLKNPFDTVTEGIGINRITKNFMMAELDGAYRGTDQEAVEMSRSVLIFYHMSISYLSDHALHSGWSLPSFLGCYAVISFVSFGLITSITFGKMGLVLVMLYMLNYCCIVIDKVWSLTSFLLSDLFL